MRKKVLLSIIIGLLSAYGIMAQTSVETPHAKNYKVTNNVGPINNGYRQMQTSPLNYRSGTLFQSEFTNSIKGEPDSSNVTLVARALYGPADCVVSQGTYTYVGAGGALLVFDCADPDTSILVGSLHLGVNTGNSIINYIYIKDNFVYIANKYEGLWIIDVSDHTNPCKVSEVDIEDRSLGVFVQGNFAYVTTGNESGEGALWVINVSDPFNPVITGNNTTIGYSAGISVVDSCAYICSPGTSSSLTIMNINNPSTPQLITNFALSGAGHIFNIQVFGDIAYIPADEAGLYIVDVSDTANPYLINAYVPPGWSCLDHAVDIVISDGIAYMSTESRIFILDVFDPSNPICLASYSSGTQFLSFSIAISGSMVYSAGGLYGLSAIDVSDPSLPIETNVYKTGNWCTDVVVNGDYAYVSNTVHGTRILDISDIYNPSEVASYTEQPSYSSFFDDGNLYATGFFNTPTHVLDVANPLYPVEIANYPDYLTYNIQVIDTLLYATDSDVLFFILDIADLTNPSIIGNYTVTGSGLLFTFGFKVVDIGDKRYAFVAATEAGVVILDVTDPTNPVEIANIPCNRAYDVVISGNYLYISEFGIFPTVAGGMKVVDISDPSNPVVKGSYSLPDPTDAGFDITVSGNYVYLAASYKGLRVIDVSNPSSPQEVGYHYAFSGQGARGIALLESGSEFPYVLIAHSYEGLWIYQYEKPVGIEENNTSALAVDMLFQSYPNPFNSNTTISYQLKEAGKVMLNIYNVQGQLVNNLVDEYQENGNHSIIWNGNDENGKTVANGTYLYKLQTDKISATKKMFILK